MPSLNRLVANLLERGVLTPIGRDTAGAAHHQVCAVGVARHELGVRLGRLVLLGDVSRAFVLAEHRFGAGHCEPDMVYVFIGSHGVGGGAFVNGQMLVTRSASWRHFGGPQLRIVTRELRGDRVLGA